MGWLSVALGCLAAYLHYTADRGGLAMLSTLVTIVCLWSYGVMHNFAVEAATKRLDYKGGFGDFNEDDLAAVPPFVTNVSLASTILILILLAWAAFIHLRT